jgi:RimJ/RimL family protein N-acetyltransferase
MEATLRRATTSPSSPGFFEDARFLLSLRNEPETRQMSGDTAALSWETHFAWYCEAVRNPRRHIYIVQCQAVDAGMVRLDGDEKSPGLAEISIALAPDFRGKGLGRLAIQTACAEGARLGYQAILARVKHTNPRSIAAFHKAGFVTDHEEDKGGCQLLALQLHLAGGK